MSYGVGWQIPATNFFVKFFVFDDGYFLAELGTSLFEIAKSLFALERTLILGAMALSKNKSKERQANWQNANSERFTHERYKEKRAQ